MSGSNPGERAGKKAVNASTLNVFERALTAARLWYLRRQTTAALSHLDERLRSDVGFARPHLHEPPNAAGALWTKPHLRPDVR